MLTRFASEKRALALQLNVVHSPQKVAIKRHWAATGAVAASQGFLTRRKGGLAMEPATYPRSAFVALL